MTFKGTVLLFLLYIVGVTTSSGLNVAIIATMDPGQFSGLVGRMEQINHQAIIFVPSPEINRCISIFGKGKCFKLHGVNSNINSGASFWSTVVENNIALKERLDNFRVWGKSPPDVFVADIFSYAVQDVASAFGKPTCFLVNGEYTTLEIEHLLYTFHDRTVVPIPDEVSIPMKSAIRNNHVITSIPLGVISRPSCPNIHRVGILGSPKRSDFLLESQFSKKCKSGILYIEPETLNEEQRLVLYNASISFALDHEACVVWSGALPENDIHKPSGILFELTPSRSTWADLSDSNKIRLIIAPCRESSVYRAIQTEAPLVGILSGERQQQLCHQFSLRGAVTSIELNSMNQGVLYTTLKNSWSIFDGRDKIRDWSRYNRLLGSEQRAVEIIEYVSSTYSNDFLCKPPDTWQNQEVHIILACGIIGATFLYVIQGISRLVFTTYRKPPHQINI